MWELLHGATGVPCSQLKNSACVKHGLRASSISVQVSSVLLCCMAAIHS